MTTIRYTLEQGIATLTFDEPGSPVNTMCEDWQRDLATATAQVVADREAIRGIVLASAKSTFFAGADLKATMRLAPDEGPRVFASVEQTKKCFRTLETLGLPVVACLNGSALGGGWELALAAHHRIAVDDPAIQFGLPELTLGLIPGASGITKMTRLLGLAGAQPYILDSRLFGPREGLEAGLLHALVPDAAALRPAALAWIEAHPRAQQPWDDKKYRMPGGTPAEPRVAAALTLAPAALRRKTRGLYPAPEYALAAMAEGAQVDFDTASRIESRYLARLVASPVTRNMVNTFFFDLNAVKSGRSRPRDVPRWKPGRVGILGAGQVGAGLAWAQASRGIQTVLQDVTTDRAEAGKAHSERLARQQVEAGRIGAAEAAALLARIHPTERNEDLAGCEQLVEAVYENRALKARVTAQAEPQLADGGVFASHTTALSVAGLAQASARPARFVGLHLLRPTDTARVVEVVRGPATDAETVARAFDYARALGKLPIVVNDAPGFFTGRVYASYLMEGAALLDEGIPAAVVEQAGLQAGMASAPLAALDELGLSLLVHALDQARADWRAAGRTHIATAGELLVERMVKEFDRNGRAAGAGFYDHAEGTAGRRLWPSLRELFERPGATWDLQALRDRLLYRQAVEAARCLAEGVLDHVHDANVGSVFGFGFPGWTGGVLQFVYGQGLESFCARAESLAARHGPGFELGREAEAALRKHQPRW